MKKKIISLLIILTMLIVIPFLTVKRSIHTTDEDVKKETKLYSKEDIYSFVYKQFRKEYEDETLKALSVLIQTNFSTDKKYITKHKDYYLSKDGFYEKHKDNAEEYNNRIRKAVDEVYKKEILIKNKKQFITFSYVTDNQNTSGYKFINECATPWDKITTEYKSSSITCGVSINTINNLCKNSYTYKEALSYFLKNFSIK